MHKTYRRSVLALALLAGMGMAHAQDSGVGVDLHFGSALDPSGVGHPGCDPNGPTWLSGERLRSPTGFLYDCIPDRPDFTPVDAQSGWTSLGTFALGYLHVTGDEKNAEWRKYNDLDDGMIGMVDLSLQRPADGTYADFRAQRASSKNQFFRLVAGQAGQYRVQAFGRTTSHVVSGNARSIWDGVGSDHLTLKPGLLPIANTPAQVAAVSAAQPERMLRVVRDKFGLGANYYFSRQWSGYLNASHEQRDGARPFGGALMFNFGPFTGNNGGIYEIPRPIKDSTVNFNAGVRYAGTAWRMELGYNGSFFRNGYNQYDYVAPYRLNPFFLLPPGIPNAPPSGGSFAYEPENDHHRLFATFTRRFGERNEFSVTGSAGRMRQDDDLLPPANCQGQLGIFLPIPGALIDCANWNTTAALSQKTADLAIETRRLHGRLVIRPSDALTWRTQVDYNKQDYQGDYVAFNPLTQQWGYIMVNGGFGAVIPGEFGIFDPRINPSTLTRVRNLTLDKTTSEISTSLDWNLNRQHTLGASLGQLRTKRGNSEVETVTDNTLKLSWNYAVSDRFTLRSHYAYMNRSGSEYNYDPYEHTYSSDLPGFVTPPGGLPAHTVDAMRKYHLSDRTQHKLNVMATFVLPHNMTLHASARADRNDYDALIGRQGQDSSAYTLQWEWQPNTATAASAWLGRDSSELRLANVNDDPSPTAVLTDHTLGGVTYQLANRWWLWDEHRNNYAGVNLNTRFGRAKLDLAWNWMDAVGTTRYTYASPTALANPELAAGDPGRLPDMVTIINSLTVGLSFAITPSFGVRIFDTYERGRLSDWHYQNFNATQVYDRRVYTDGGPEDYSVNTVGLLLEFKL